MANKAPLDTTIAVVTPENIAFEYQIAGPFRRLPAYLIDVLLRLGILFAVLIVLMLSGITVSGLLGGSFGVSLAAAIFLIAFFLLSWFYGVFFETYFNGRTPGKWACGLRTISDDGHPISGMQALIRNLLREADLLPATTLVPLDAENPLTFIPLTTGLVALVTMTCTRRLQRLGDLAAGTMVVVDQRNWALPVTRVDDSRVAALASFVPADYRVTASMARALASYAERRAFLSPARRREIAKHLAIPLIERFEFRADIDTDLLLYALYYRTFLTDPSDQPSDLGPLAAYSPLAKDMEVQGMIGSSTDAIAMHDRGQIPPAYGAAGGIPFGEAVTASSTTAVADSELSTHPSAVDAQRSSGNTINDPHADPPPP
jgi:uncharacterized RDD family membrane protein YckC